MAALALMRADGRAVRDVVITLVHGTWPRNIWRDALLTPFYGRWPNGYFPKNLWFADGSEFRNRLTAALSQHGLSAQVSAFLWSGANSVRERDKAARQLVEHIRAKQAGYPNSIQLLVAHSHGGNVALRALDQLGVTRDDIFIATIATPFVEILRSKLSPTETEWIDRFAITVGVFLSPQIAIVGSYFEIGINVLSLIGGVFPLLVMLLFRGLRASNPARVDELVGLTSLSPSVRKHPLLVLRAVDDEASLTLSAAAIGNRLSRLLARWSSKIWRFLLIFFGVQIFIFFVLLIIIGYFQIGLDFMDRYQPALGFWVALYVKVAIALQIGLLLVFFASLLSPGACKSFFGRELLLNGQGCEINSQSAPDSIDRQSEFRSASDSIPTTWGMVVTLHQAEGIQGRLRHGLYEDPQCAERIGGWLKSELDRRVT
jgi:hypothetical protein